MTDVFSIEKRHLIMSKIKNKDSKIELLVRKWVYSKGIRYRKNSRLIPGTPDISIFKYKIAVYINGCFWHGHENCRLFRQPQTNADFWEKKIKANKERDARNYRSLVENGWHVFQIWECDLKAHPEETLSDLVNKIQAIIKLSKQS